VSCKSLARMELACVLREGLMSFMYNIFYTKQSNLLLHFFRTLKRCQSLFCCCHAVFEGVSQLLNDSVHLRVDVGVGKCTRHNLHCTNHIFFFYYYFFFLCFYLGDYTHRTCKYLMYFSNIIYSFYTLHFFAS